MAIFFFFLSNPGGWRPLSASLLCSQAASPWPLTAVGAPRGADLGPTEKAALRCHLPGRTACSLNKQIPRWEPIQGCHVFPDEIPDLVCCVFLKTRPLPPKTSAEEKHFSLNYWVLKGCQVMPHFHGLHTPVFPLTALEESPRWQSLAVISAALAFRGWEN